MTSNNTATAVGVGVDEDNWQKTTDSTANKDCPDGNPFVTIPSVINGNKTKTKWWTNYWWGIESKGTYIYGGGQFDSCFDPKKFYEQTEGGLKLKAFYDTHREYGDSWVTSEIVLGGLDTNDYNRPGYGHYAVVAKADDFGSLDSAVVLGIFTYQFGRANSNDDGWECSNVNREIDLLETISKSQQGLEGNAQFALQPASPNPPPDGSSLWRFAIPKKTPSITVYMFRAGDPYGKSGIDLKIYAGDYTLAEITSKSPPKPLDKGAWTVGFMGNENGYKWRQNIPRHKNERMHINFYVPGGNNKGTADRNKAHEVFINRFEYQSG